MSIDCSHDGVEVIICEDCAPRRDEVRNVVSNFARTSDYKIIYNENIVNLGFDGNLRRLIECANGEYIIFMGDDDLFIANKLNLFVEFLKKNRDKHYILRSYITKHSDGRIEYFKYLPQTKMLPAGEKTVAWLFKRSVSLCGFTILKEKAQLFSTTHLDGTLLYQVYLMAQVCLHNDSVYCDIAFAHAVQSFRDDKPMFGHSIAEKSRYTPGSITHDNSINFAKSYFEVTTYLDNQHGTRITNNVRLDLSKYSYPFLSIQRKRGIISFLSYAKRLDREVGLGCTIYFHIFKWSLVFLGEKVCDRIIGQIKNTLGHTPNF